MLQNWTDFEMVVDINTEGTYDTDHVYEPMIIKEGSTYKMWYNGEGGAEHVQILYCDSSDCKNWSNHQMVVDAGEEGTYDTKHVGKPTVLKDGSTYKMWYAAKGNAPNNQWRILYCDSNDGINWANHQLVVDLNQEGTYDTSDTRAPTVIKDGSTYKMWYGAFSSGGDRSILYCESTDGINWENHQAVILAGSEGTYDSSYCQAPTVLYNDSIYRMWYTGGDGSAYRIIYCTSKDGINWSNFTLAVDKDKEGTYDTDFSYACHVLEDRGTYRMWYSGRDDTNWRILYCANFAEHWTDHQLTVISGSEGTYDTHNIYEPHVIKDNSTYKMWYSGLDVTGGNWRVIYCDSDDGTSWDNFQLAIDIGDEGTYDTRHSARPAVIKDGSTYKMWYAGRQVADNKWRIIYCDSADGENWSNHEMVIDVADEGTYDTEHSYSPMVIKDGSTYKMWYSGKGGIDNDWRIIYCDSSDGKTWSNHQLVVDKGDEGTYDIGHAGYCGVIKHNEKFKMWYSGKENGIWRIIYCDSDDGINWENHHVVIDILQEGTYDYEVAAPSIIEDVGNFEMWYAGYDNEGWNALYARSLSLSGEFSGAARMFVLNEEDWSLESNTEESEGRYIVTTTSGLKTIIARKSNGECQGYGNILVE